LEYEFEIVQLVSYKGKERKVRFAPVTERLKTALLELWENLDDESKERTRAFSLLLLTKPLGVKVRSELKDEKQYDAATAILVMHFLPDDGSKLNFLKAIHRRLKPGAKLIVADGCFDKTSKEFDWLLNAFISHAKLNGAPPEILNQTLEFIEESPQSITETRELELLAEANFGEIRSFFPRLVV